MKNITIGNDSLIAEMVVICDQNHKYTIPGIPISKQGMQTPPITIGNNVWLGAKVTVLVGSYIADNMVVGAHGLVNNKLDSSVYIGTPQKWKKN